MKNVVVAVVVLSLAALSFWAGGRYGKWPSAGPGSQGEREVLYYVDPMTPGFRSDKPGIAPCGMPLEPVYADAGDGQVSAALGAVSMSPGAVKVSPARQQLIGVTVRPVEVKPMTYTLRLYGRIVSDETKIYRINASTDSWVRQLSDITTGSIVGKDQLLAEVLAPAFYNAQVTYLVAMDNLDRIRAQLGVEIRHQQTHLADNQIRMAVQNLQNLGITDA
jgi:Cu(I)/Ag(I) efflux system membrane fusion protein